METFELLNDSLLSFLLPDSTVNSPRNLLGSSHPIEFTINVLLGLYDLPNDICLTGFLIAVSLSILIGFFILTSSLGCFSLLIVFVDLV